LALEWQREKRAAHSACGHPIDESADEAHSRAYEAHEMTCYACMVIDLRRNALNDQERDTAGLVIYATRKGDGND
jgi:hypothetical protein